MFTLTIVDRSVAKEVRAVALAGDPIALRLAYAVLEFWKHLASIPGVCLLCDDTISVRALPDLLIVIAEQDHPGDLAATCAVCPACAANSSDDIELFGRRRPALKKLICPDLRVIKFVAGPGHA